MAFTIVESSLSGVATSVKALASDGGGHVVGVGQDSVTIRSADNGATFVAADNIPYGNWIDLAYGGGRYLAIADSSNTCAYSTDNGLTFTTADIGAWMRKVAYAVGRWVACSSSAVKYSDDGGVTWGSVTPPESWSLNPATLIHNGSVWLVLQQYGNKAYISSNGVTWVAYTTVDLGQQLSNLVWVGGQYVGLARNSNKAYTSSDGITWVAVTMPVSRYWGRLTHNGVRFFGTAGEQNTNSYITSLDAATWTSGTFASTSYWQALTSSGTNVIAVSSSPTKALGTGDVGIEAVYGDLAVTVDPTVDASGLVNVSDVIGDFALSVDAQFGALGGFFETVIGNAFVHVQPVVSIDAFTPVLGEMAITVQPKIVGSGVVFPSGQIEVVVTPEVVAFGSVATVGNMTMIAVAEVDSIGAHYPPIRIDPIFEANGAIGAAGVVLAVASPIVHVAGGVGVSGNAPIAVGCVLQAKGVAGSPGQADLIVQPIFQAIGVVSDVVRGDALIPIVVDLTALGGAYKAVFGGMSLAVSPGVDIRGETPIQDASAYLTVVQRQQQITVLV